MNEEELKALFDQSGQSEAKPEAKRKAINLAMQAFTEASAEELYVADYSVAEVSAKSANEQVDPETPQKQSGFFQGFWQRLRPTSNNDDGRRQPMNQYPMMWRYGAGVAFAFACTFAVLVGINHTDTISIPTVEYPEQDLSSASQSKEERDYSFADEDIAAGPSVSGPVSSTSVSGKGAAEPAKVAPKPASPMEVVEMEMAEVIVSQRSALEKAPSAKREAKVDSLSAEDIGQLSDAANSSSLQRLHEQRKQSLQAREMEARKKQKHMQAKMLSSEPDIKKDVAEQGRDRFSKIETNPVKLVAEEPVSTFSIDVDTAAYSFVRRQLNRGVMPQKDAVRIEEMLNYFDYQYPAPKNKSEPFAAQVVVSDAPWKKGNKLIHIGIKGYELERSQLPKSNIVFLLDVSGSMNSDDKLPLVKQSMSLLLDQLNEDDNVAIVVYAGAAGTVLEPTPVKQKQKIITAMNQLQAGGSTAGAQGIQLAYQLAEANFDKQAVNRVILATDGDFNVGIRNPDELKAFVERKRKSGVYLSVLGFGQGNYHDHMMQQLAQNGNGVAAYIDTLSEAQKVLVEEATSSLFPIANDVKIQVEFNPSTVKEYRLIGYETRQLKREDFNNDKVDAGDIGAGHTVTAIYEITPVGAESALIEPTRYTTVKSNEDKTAASANTDKANEYGFVKMRYKLPQQQQSSLISIVIPAKSNLDQQSSLMQQETQFATAVAGFAQLLKGGQYTGDWNYDDAIQLALQHRGEDAFGYRTEFVQLIRKAKIAK